ncbi:MAG: hypothetical protein ACNYVW_00420 [Methanosarcinales archaeon]
MKDLSVCIEKRVSQEDYWCAIKEFNRVVFGFQVRNLEEVRLILETLPEVLKKVTELYDEL